MNCELELRYDLAEEWIIRYDDIHVTRARKREGCDFDINYEHNKFETP